MHKLQAKNDLIWMKRALGLAEKGRGWTSPNPVVGAVIVKNGRLAGEGWHKEFGKEHAEIMALREAGNKAEGATLYVTLEPCSSWGKTPPCLDRIIQSKLKKVVIGLSDPNPRHAGKALKKLRESKIQVEIGLMSSESERQNENFIKWITTGFPFITLKMAQSLDGKIASYTGNSRWISNPLARHYVHQLRAEHDAVMVGAETFRLDNPKLSPVDVSQKLPEGKPWRVVLLSRKAHMPVAKWRVLEGNQRTIFAVSEKNISQMPSLKNPNVFFLAIAEKQGRLDLNILLKKLGQLGVSNLLVEGGGELAWSLLSGKNVDRLIWIIAPKILGGKNAKTSVEGLGFKAPDEAIEFSFSNIRKLGNDFVLEANLSSHSSQKKK